MKTEKSDILTFLFWLNFAVFTLHVMDETLMGGGFVPFIQRHFWTGFVWGDFAVANAVWLILIAIAIYCMTVLATVLHSLLPFPCSLYGSAVLTLFFI